MAFPPLPPTRREPPAPPDPDKERLVPKLAAPPLAWPRSPPSDPYWARRDRADHLCLWMACTRMVCRRARSCRGRLALCVFEFDDVKTPILQSVGARGSR